MKKLLCVLFSLLAYGSYAQLGNDIRISYSTALPLYGGTRAIKAPDGYKLVSYNLSFLPRGEDLVGPYSVVEGKQLSPEVLKVIGHCRPGDKMFLDNIRLKENATGKIVMAENFSTVLQ